MLNKSHLYQYELSQENYIKHISLLIETSAAVIWNKKRNNYNYLIGSTDFAGNTVAKFTNPFKIASDTCSGESMLPRLYGAWLNAYIKSNLCFMQNPWFKYFTEDLSTITITHLLIAIENAQSENNSFLYDYFMKIYIKILFVRDKLPKSLKIYDSIFTQVSIVGTFPIPDSKGEIPLHKDEKDIISCVVTLGNVSRGGSTLYYNGIDLKSPGEPILDIPFNHGRIQIGCYSQILHEVSKWQGNRVTINFNIKEPIVEHFEKFGNYFYKQYEEKGYPTELYVAE